MEKVWKREPNVKTLRSQLSAQFLTHCVRRIEWRNSMPRLVYLPERKNKYNLLSRVRIEPITAVLTRNRYMTCVIQYFYFIHRLRVSIAMARTVVSIGRHTAHHDRRRHTLQ